MKVSLVISAYNEEIRLAKTLPGVIDYMKKFGKENNVETEIVIYDDGSSDKTYYMIKQYPEVRAFSQGKNMGKGYGLRAAVKETTGDYIYLTDADFSTPIEFIDEFYKLADQYDCIIGSRALETKNVKVSFIRKLLGSFGNLMIRVILGLSFKDTQCGFKMFNKKAKEYFLMCKNNRWGFDFEFLYLLNRDGLTIKEIPVKWSAVGDSRVKPFDYFKTLSELLKVRWMHRR